MDGSQAGMVIRESRERDATVSTAFERVTCVMSKPILQVPRLLT